MDDILIIGAGAAGLMAMKNLLSDGYKVTILEAAPVPGGRIMTLHDNRFDMPAEGGAEFIHGDLPLTKGLLNTAVIPYEQVSQNMQSVQQGDWKKENVLDKYWEEIKDKLDKMDTDMTIHDFLLQYFPGPVYTEMRSALLHFAEGFDLSDIFNASVLAIKEEWSHMDETQYRIKGGYERLIKYLVKLCTEAGGNFYYNTCVTKIDHSNDMISVHSPGNKIFTARKVLITVPAGVLKSGSIVFTPALSQHAQAIKQLGFGSVIKILLQFNYPFWKNKNENTGFVLSGEPIPTWWTQMPRESNLLTGWLGGPAATRRAEHSDLSVLKEAILSLSSIFKTSAVTLEKELQHYRIINWQQNSNVKGGYSYNTLHSMEAKKILAEPAAGKLFFAGEALYQGAAQGTVEAALQSGNTAAKKITASLQQHD